MAAPVQVSPVLWVQFRLSGGWRSALVLLCGYGMLLAVLAIFTFHGPLNVSSKTVASGWLITMNMIQTGLLTLIGTSAVRRAILQDFTSGLFDSHRLTAMTAPAAVFGYMIGPNVGPLLFLGVNAVLGLVLCPMSGHPIPEWLLGIGFELMFALLLWTFAAVSALGTQGSAKLVVFMLFLAAIGGWAIIVFVPGIGLLALGLLAAAFNLMPGFAGTMMPGTALATLTLTAQCMLGAILFWAAVRKYRRPDLRAFPIWLALILVGSQAASGGIGIQLWSQRPRVLNDFPSPDVFTQIVATLAVLSLLAMLAVAAAVHAHVRWERARRWDPAGAGRRPLPPLAWTVVTVSLLVGALWVMGAPAWPWVAVPYGVVWPRWLASFGALTLGLIPPMLLLKPLYRRNAVGGPIVGLWLLLVWLVPMLVDLIVNVAMVPEEQARVTWLFGCSPLGALILIWKIESVSFLPGLAFAGALALLVAILTRPRTRLVGVNPAPAESSPSSEQTRTE